ncbi:unnamed protein product [Periconia digitata]|uniref:Zn(2)-C6 fungal-type domain-containing protein n=1 Tax=Periconia digitata TaxID=1303443 RepID=A0A9W4UH44_9PLEO|nr:unnamed protein product [Periconia digitata]
MNGKKRTRTVDGTCWPCRKRRIKCDLGKPQCRRCILNGTASACHYNALDLRWKIAATSKSDHVPTTPPVSSISDGTSLAINEKRAIDYFVARLWPLLSTSGQPCKPPVSLGLRFKPVLQTICVFSDSHRAQDMNTSEQTLTYQRLACLGSIREYLDRKDVERSHLSSLLTAVILLYFLDGFVDCAQRHASTQFHHAGAIAILTELGGFQKARATSSKATSMLLSEFATTDLTAALLQSRTPYLPANIWREMELQQPVWWEVSDIPKSLASVFETMAEMSFYRHSIGEEQAVCFEKVANFEKTLQPSYLVIGDAVSMDAGDRYEMSLTMATYSFCRAFQHAALIYLYRAICKMPTSHALVQQHVHGCLECIRGVDFLPEVQKCSLFPLYVAGAHALTEVHRTYVIEKLDSIYVNLRFESVVSIRANLIQLWEKPLDISDSTWSDTFKEFTGKTTLVL